MQVWNASLTVTNSSFVHNRMSVTAGAYGNMMGGGLCYEGRRLQMENVVLASNSLGSPDRNCQEARGGGKTHTQVIQTERERERSYIHTQRKSTDTCTHIQATHREEKYTNSTRSKHKSNHPCL
jgi:hypothetical protein